MRRFIIGLCALSLWTPTIASMGPSPSWSATNSEGSCSLSYFAAATEDATTFEFVLVPQYGDRPEAFAFLVKNPEGPLQWPVRVAFGREDTARQVAIGPALNGRRYFSGAEAEELLTHLRTGGELRVDYLLCNGAKGRAILGQQYFAQSVAMFDACVATNP